MKCPKCDGDMEEYEWEEMLRDEFELKEVWKCPWCGLWIDKRVPCTERRCGEQARSQKAISQG